MKNNRCINNIYKNEQTIYFYTDKFEYTKY